MRLIMYPAFMSASDPHEFKKTLGVLLVYRNKNYQPRPGDVIFGWGNSNIPNWAGKAEQHNCLIINHWNAIKNAVDKARTFKLLTQAGISTVQWTTDYFKAKTWLTLGKTVFARRELRGNKGAGIVVMKTPHELVEAPLYTKYKPDCGEYRVHVAFGKVINFQQKLRKNGVKCDPYVRSEENGWVFARKNIQLPAVVDNESVKAVYALGLDFGAVDCLYDPHAADTFILEVNTAPGLDYQYGIEAYTEAFQQRIRRL